MSQHITVVDYDPSWPERYLKERKVIAGILGTNCIAVWHIGSTSVPGMAAKPVIDIMAAVRDLSLVDDLSALFAQAGYEYMGEYGIPGRRYLRKGGLERTHQIHIFRADDTGNIVRHLAFREFMASHDEERSEYSHLKKELAVRFPYDIDGYCDGKDAFVRSMEEKALQEYDESWDRLYLSAAMARKERQISPFIEAGSVAASVLTADGNIYSGVCIDTACSLGMCAERNAVASMITNGEHLIKRLAVVMPDGLSGLPCGACQEMLMQLGPSGGDIEILCDYERKESVTLSRLVGPWWGMPRYGAGKDDV